MIMSYLIDGFPPLLFLRMRHQQPMRGSHWQELTNETSVKWDLINSIQDPDLQCWNFLVCTQLNLDTTQHNLLSIECSALPGALPRLSTGAQGAVCTPVRIVQDLRDPIKVPGITWHQQTALTQWDLLSFSRLRTKGGGDNQDYSDSSPAPCSSWRTSL